MLEIYNTLKRDKEPFVSRNDNRINLFVCGPTVYDDAHIGHGRTYISFDMIKSYLEFIGYSVFYLENITDIDDKIIVRAKEKGIHFEILARFYEKRFKEDMSRLNVNAVNLYPRATDHLKEIYSQIERLLEKGFAYETEDGIYFEVSKFPEYGKLSHQKIEKLESHRKTAETTKRNTHDFALWKKTSEEPYFPSKWGTGRPGWHIEDTAITEEYFGPQYDIHGGGLDLIFPHHEAEIAQMEAVSGKEPLVKYWLHTGFLNVDGEKMSKSLGNFITIRELLENWDPMAFRLFVLSTHYRSPIDFSEKSLNQALKNLNRLKSTVERLFEFRKVLRSIRETKNYKNPNLNFGQIDCLEDDFGFDLLVKLNSMEEEFFRNMNDDFNSPRSLAVVLNFTKFINNFINQKMELFSQYDDDKIPDEELKIPFEFVCKSLKFFIEFEKIFKLNLFLKDEKPQDEDLSANLLDILLETREIIRKDKNYQLSDYIRDKIIELGINVEDGK
ncbi:MAG: cysteine--tRNA ligase [Methanobrevibacter sp.]|jgi:cysteinyl-tRNA synthetase|nr:cysteine--tRNA ligase [Methanobrevibacter sp.]